MGSTRNKVYYGPSEAVTNTGFIGCVLCLAIPMALAVICTICTVVGCSAEQPEEETASSNVVYIDTSDAWTMHTLGLPTKSDMMGYHMYGRWGYSRYEGEEQIYTTHIWEGVPGNPEAWDELYGIDPENKAFKYPRKEVE